MNAGHIMTRQVVTVGPEANVVDIARLMLERNISGVPVVDEEMRVLGIVSEGDLVRRHEIGTGERHHSWWLNFITGPATQAQEYTKAHAKRARDVMTSPAITVDEDTTIAEIAEALEKNHIKRVPVVRGDRLVGIVSRANIVQLLAAAKRLEVPVDASDDKLRQQILDVLGKQPWASLGLFNVTVNKGVVEFWGFVRSEAEQRAARAAAESIGGVKRVEDHRSVRDLSTISGV
jgi:CBS domain-containing protein